MSKPKLGSGQRFHNLVQSIKHEPGMNEQRAEAIAASIGRKKYGAKKFNSLAKRGK